MTSTKAIQLHGMDENIIGTILLGENTNKDKIHTLWDSYLVDMEEKEESPCIYEFTDISNFKFSEEDELCVVLDMDFYQP